MEVLEAPSGSAVGLLTGRNMVRKLDVRKAARSLRKNALVHSLEPVKVGNVRGREKKADDMLYWWVRTLLKKLVRWSGRRQK